MQILNGQLPQVPFCTNCLGRLQTSLVLELIQFLNLFIHVHKYCNIVCLQWQKSWVGGGEGVAAPHLHGKLMNFRTF